MRDFKTSNPAATMTATAATMPHQYFGFTALFQTVASPGALVATSTGAGAASEGARGFSITSRVDSPTLLFARRLDESEPASGSTTARVLPGAESSRGAFRRVG